MTVRESRPFRGYDRPEYRSRFPGYDRDAYRGRFRDFDRRYPLVVQRPMIVERPVYYAEPAPMAYGIGPAAIIGAAIGSFIDYQPLAPAAALPPGRRLPRDGGEVIIGRQILLLGERCRKSTEIRWREGSR